MNYLSPFQQFQMEKYGNVLQEKPELTEEYEYLNMENREACEWIEKEAEIDNNNQQ